MSDGVRKLTVSELIRESKPDWEHVRRTERRATTGAFSGALQVSMGMVGVHDAAGRLVGGILDMDNLEPFDQQVERFDRQNLSGVIAPVFGEDVCLVDDEE